MKILHIGQQIGGLDIYIRNTIEYLPSTIEFVVIRGREDNAKEIIKNNSKIKTYEVDLYRSLGIRDLKCFIQILKIIKREKPNLIHCHSAKGGIIGRCIGRILAIPTLYTPHAFSFFSTNNKIVKKIYIFFERITRFNTYLLACSHSERDIGTSIVHYNEKKALVWVNSVPDALNTIVGSNCKEIISKEKYVVTIGRPSFQKNSLNLLEIFNLIHLHRPELQFFILGVGHYSPYLQSIKQKINEYHLENVVTLVDWVDKKIALRYLKEAELYITTALYEGLPLSVLEAMSLSLPIIASDVYGNKDCVVDSYNGYLIDVNNLNLFSEKTLSLIENENLKYDLGNNSRRLFNENFNIVSQIKKLESIYCMITKCKI